MNTESEQIVIRLIDYPNIREKIFNLGNEFFSLKGVDNYSKVYDGLVSELENYYRTIADFNEWKEVSTFTFRTERERNAFLMKWSLM